MSNKTITLNAHVYEKLNRFKIKSETFSQAIDRLIESAPTAHTGDAILCRLSQIPPLEEKDAEIMGGIVKARRANERWHLQKTH